MSWLFSQVLVEAYSEANCLGGEQCAQLSVMPTQHKFWRNDKMIEPSSLSRFGLTCAVLTENHGKGLLTSYQAVFRAKTSPSQVPEKELMGKGQGFGRKWLESSVRYNLNTSSWKTHQCLFEEDLQWSLVILPAWGMTQNGVVYQHLTAERPISVTGSGYWPTPTASMAKGSSAGTLMRKDGRSRVNDRLDHRIFHDEGGQLNPRWVEWLMGWPVGWTSLEPLEMDKFHEWRQQHSAY